MSFDHDNTTHTHTHVCIHYINTGSYTVCVCVVSWYKKTFSATSRHDSCRETCTHTEKSARSARVYQYKQSEKPLLVIWGSIDKSHHRRLIIYINTLAAGVH